jgi:hypothetical protein
MAKKKPAVKMPVKKAEAKKQVVKKVADKSSSKKEKIMAKKTVVPTKKSPSKPSKKPAPVVKKALSKPAHKPAASKVQPKSLKEQMLKAAGKLVAKVAPKTTKTPEKGKTKPEKVVKDTKADAQKLKLQKENDKKKQKELEQKKKEDLKLKLQKEKEAAKLAKKGQGKSKKAKDEEEDEEAFGEEPVETKSRRSDEDEDFDEFEEDYKKSKAAKKAGKKAYEEDVEIDLFEAKGSKKYSNQVLADLEGKISEEIAELREHFNWKEIAGAIGTMDFFIDPKNDECIEKGCDNIRTTQSYCRLHYLRNWKVIQKKKEILQEGKLQEYIEELISKYPPKYIEALLSDLSDDKEFYRVLNELNITSDFDFEEDEFENAVDDDSDDDDLGIETISTTLRYEDE